MPNSSKSELQRRPVAPYVVLGAALLVIIEAYTLLAPIFLALLLILVISMALNPLIARLGVWTRSRSASTALVTTVFVIIIAMTGWAFTVPLKSSTEKMVERLPAYWDRLQKPLIKMEQKAVQTEKRLQAEVSAEMEPGEGGLEGAGEGNSEEGNSAGREVEPTPVVDEPVPPKPAEDVGGLRDSLGNGLQSVAGSFAGAAVNAAEILFVLITVFFGVIFTLANPRPIIGVLFLLTPERHHAKALAIVGRIGEFMPTWALATLLAMVTIGVLVFLLMWPIFGFTDALVLGLIAGVLESIPYVGPILSALPALLLGLGEGGMTPMWVVAAFLSIQALENNVILPLIMARRMKMHPLFVFLSMLICGVAFGVLGILVAVPVVAIVHILHDEIYRKLFLPTVSDKDLEALASKALQED